MAESSPSPEDLARINACHKVRESRCEIVDSSTREVWQDFEPTPRQWYDDLEPAPPLVKVAYGSGNMDRAWFRRSPDGEVDGPVRTREIDGRRFFYCATPMGSMSDGVPRRLMVDKHHSLAYDAGRTVEILTTDTGSDYVKVVEAAAGSPPPILPEGWSVRSIELESEWTVHLPAPTETFWFEGSLSYQGPISPPSSGRKAGG